MSSALLLVASVQAAGLPIDVELARPALAPGGLLGIDSPWTVDPGLPRAAALVQSEQDPIVVYAGGDYAGPAVSSRALLQAAVRWAPVRNVDVSLAVPFAWQQGSEFPGGADGSAAGDVELAARWNFLGGTRGALGARADVALPSGDSTAWMGEGIVRPGGALLGALRFDAFTVLGEGAFRLGAPAALDLGLYGGSSLQTNAGVRWDWRRVGLGFGYLGRYRLVAEAGPRDQASALAATMDVRAPRGFTFSFGGGPGLGGGVGAATLRSFVGLAWTPQPVEPRARPVSTSARDLAPPVEEVPDTVVRPPPAPAVPGWAEGELAKVAGDRIVIRDPIRFVFAKDEVVPESIPILHDVARVLAENPRIAYIVVEGHASEEGSFEYNYALSTARARAVYRVLIEAGVHPDRLGYRAMGEVAPESAGQDEASLASNRRVLFRIERQLASDQPAPEWPPVPVPWTGRLPAASSGGGSSPRNAPPGTP